MPAQGVRQIRTLAEAKSRRVYLKVIEDERWIEADLFDELAIGSQGKIQPELHIACPRCNGALRVDGHEFRIDVRYLDPPRVLTMPDGERVTQTAVISVEGFRRCPNDAAAGKGLCGWGAVIRENRVYPS